MYDRIVKSYIAGEINKETCKEVMWTMGASTIEIFFYMQEADKQRAQKDPGFGQDKCSRCGSERRYHNVYNGQHEFVP